MKTLSAIMLFSCFGMVKLASAIDCAALPSCSDLGYNESKSSAYKCYGKYFTCPFDANYIKCDRYAHVGDIRYRKDKSSIAGWLLCDGTRYSASKYPELNKLIGHKFGGSVDAPYLPNYIGITLRGNNNNGDFAKFQPSSIVKHQHQMKRYLFNYTAKRKGNTAGVRNRAIYSGASYGTKVAGTGSEICLKRYGLYPFIYAGQPSE